MSGTLLNYRVCVRCRGPWRCGLVSITNDAPLEEAIARQLVRARLGQLCNKRNPAPNSQTGTPTRQPSLAVLFSVQEALIPWPTSFAEGPGSAIVQISPEEPPTQGQRPGVSASAA